MSSGDSYIGVCTDAAAEPFSVAIRTHDDGKEAPPGPWPAARPGGRAAVAAAVSVLEAATGPGGQSIAIPPSCIAFVAATERQSGRDGVPTFSRYRRTGPSQG